MIEVLHELENSSFQYSSIQAVDNTSAGKKEEFAGPLYMTKN